MIVKIGLGISLSVAAYVLTQLRTKPVKRLNGAATGELRNLGKRTEHDVEVKKEICSYSKVDSAQKDDGEEVKKVDIISPSVSSKSLGDDEQLLLPEFNDLLSQELEFHLPSEDLESSKTMKYGNDEKQVKGVDSDLMAEQDRHLREEATVNNAAEMLRLRNLVQELQKREEDYRNELFEYYGLKEQEINIVELQRRIKLNALEIEMLNLKINSLEAQKKKVEEELAEASLIKEELQSARENIKELKRQMHMESQSKRQLIQDKEKEAFEKNFEMEKKLQTLKELEMEVLELRRANKELQHEKRELMVKLDMAEAKVASLSQISQTEAIEKTREEVNLLRHENKDLSKQVEGLQNNRFSEVEELVYLRWINACLRYELRNYKAPPGKMTARDLNKNLSPRSQEKAKQLMLEYAGPDVIGMRERESTDIDFETTSSQTSTPSESGDFDDSSFDSASSKQTRSKKSSFMHKLKRWGRSKDELVTSPGGSPVDRRGSETITKQKKPHHRHSISTNPSDILTSRNLRNGGFGSKARARSKSSSFLEDHDVTSLLLDSPVREKFNTAEMSLELKDSINNVAASFQLMSKSVGGTDKREHPVSRDRHQLALQRENVIKEKAEQARMIKFSEKIKTEPFTEKVMSEKLTGKKTQETSESSDSQTDSSNDHPSKQPEISKMKLAEVQKRAPKVAKAPPNPSSCSSIDNNFSLKTSSGVPMSSAPPPRPPLAALGMPPPPPPPPPNSLHTLQGQTGDKVHRVPQVVEFYQSLVKREVQKEVTNMTSATSSKVADVHNNVIGELENRSAYLLAVKADVETQGDFVQSLAKEVRVAAYRNINDVVSFVHWLDEELSFLVDEHAVLKHFDWPENKVDALREAAFEYQDLQKLESEVASFFADPTLSCDTALSRMYTLLELVEKSVYGLLRTRDMVIARYKEFNIPTYWLLDSGLVGKIKLACVQLAQKYMKRVTKELDAIANIPEKELAREFLLLQGVRFAFRVHQFAGGFDEASMRTFEDLRRRAWEQAKDAKQQ